MVYPCQPSNEDILAAREGKKTVQLLHLHPRPISVWLNVALMCKHVVEQLGIKHTNQYHVITPLMPNGFLRNVMSVHTLASWLIIRIGPNEARVVQDKSR